MLYLLSQEKIWSSLNKKDVLIAVFRCINKQNDVERKGGITAPSTITDGPKLFTLFKSDDEPAPDSDNSGPKE